MGHLCRAGSIIVGFLLFYFLQAPVAKNSVFGTYWASGRAASMGLNPFATYPTTFRANYSNYDGPSAAPDLNLSPPVLLPLFQALSHLSLSNFAKASSAISFLLPLATVVLLLARNPRMQNRQILWLLFAEPTPATFLNGQIYFFLFLLGAAAWISFSQKREWTLPSPSD